MALVSVSLFVVALITVRAHWKNVIPCPNNFGGSECYCSYEEDIGWFYDKCRICCVKLIVGGTVTTRAKVGAWFWDDEYCYCDDKCFADAYVSDRRRLQDEVDIESIVNDPRIGEYPAVGSCLNDTVCKEVLVSYPNTDNTTPQDHCDQFPGCTTEVSDMFTAATEELDGDEEPPECPDCDKYVWDNDGVERTFEEAEEHCRVEYQSDLATVNTVQDLECVSFIVGTNSSSTWVGLWSPNRTDDEGNIHDKPYFYRNIDGSVCPSEYNGKFSGACGDGHIYEQGEPLPCYIGSQCVSFNPGSGKLNNDVQCGQKLKSVLCNSDGSASGAIPSFASVVIHDNDIKDNYYTDDKNNKYYYIYHIIGVYLYHIIGVTVFIGGWIAATNECCWCYGIGKPKQRVTSQ